jgi:predicted nucleic acid-binding protein
VTYILVDTCVFLRLPTDYKQTFDCFLVTSDVIAITKQILNEYGPRAYTSKLILQSFLQDLKGKNKLAFFKQSYVEARLSRHHRNINYPSHIKDKKWVNLAIAIRANCIISKNSHLLDLPPIKTNDEFIETILPSQYTETRCSTRTDV